MTDISIVGLVARLSEGSHKPMVMLADHSVLRGMRVLGFTREPHKCCTREPMVEKVLRWDEEVA